ncbi:agmatinase [Pseudobdellovibrio exovorus]|uniref:Agmatinase n=1 Tax=Pseudobdellovibrio exovorus JSS TaxID=1184267 RepID=M4V8D8_9BACT|nr:agmatinase [Pseudobdellovibrio exovorus]AGH94720.1 agmatinase [Pseudobdellovibrio exovorus JSS]
MANNFKPISGREFPRFSAIKTFFRLPIADIQHDFDVALFGVPYDGGVSYRPGARFAPTLVREVSSLGRGFHMTRAVSVFDQIRCADVGDCPIVPIDQVQTYEKIESFVSQIAQGGKRFISVGGDHSTTLPVLRALKKKYQQPLNFIHFDAHLDTYPAAWGCEYHHGAFARHAVEEGLVNPKTMLQIGIRGPLASGDDLDFVQKHGIIVKTVDDVREGSLTDFIKTLPKFTGPTYLSFDIDCLDPAYAPGTGTPVPGGLTTYETQRILRALQIDQLVGADIVEVCPPFDSSQITGLAAVDTMFELMCLMAGGRKA